MDINALREIADRSHYQSEYQTISEAADALAALQAENAALRERLDDAEHQKCLDDECIEARGRSIDRLKAENAALRAQVDEMRKAALREALAAVCQCGPQVGDWAVIKPLEDAQKAIEAMIEEPSHD